MKVSNHYEDDGTLIETTYSVVWKDEQLDFEERRIEEYSSDSFDATTAYTLPDINDKSILDYEYYEGERFTEYFESSYLDFHTIIGRYAIGFGCYLFAKTNNANFMSILTEPVLSMTFCLLENIWEQDYITMGYAENESMTDIERREFHKLLADYINGHYVLKYVANKMLEEIE